MSAARRRDDARAVVVLIELIVTPRAAQTTWGWSPDRSARTRHQRSSSTSVSPTSKKTDLRATIRRRRPRRSRPGTASGRARRDDRDRGRAACRGAALFRVFGRADVRHLAALRAGTTWVGRPGRSRVRRRRRRGRPARRRHRDGPAVPPDHAERHRPPVRGRRRAGRRLAARRPRGDARRGRGLRPAGRAGRARGGPRGRCSTTTPAAPGSALRWPSVARPGHRVRSPTGSSRSPSDGRAAPAGELSRRPCAERARGRHPRERRERRRRRGRSATRRCRTTRPP